MPSHRRFLPAALAVLLGAAGAVPSRVAAQDLLARARALQARGRFDSALTLIEQAARAEPGNAEVHYWLGEIAGGRAQQIGGLGALSTARKSKAGYARAVELAPDSIRYLRGLAGYLMQAPGVAGGDRDSALRLAERVRRLDETEGTFLTANVLRRGNAREKARADSLIDALGRAHDERPMQFRVSGYWASANQPERALALTQRLLARDSTDVVARYAVARNLVVLRREPAAALAHLRYALARPVPSGDQPSYAPAGAWWRMGQAFVQLGQPDSARAAYLRALQVSPDFRPARLSLDSLR